MLQDIRDNSQGVIAKIIIGLIVAVFALFGVESIIGGFITSPPVAEVNGEEITEAQLQSGTQSLMNSLGGTAQGLDQELLEQVALNQLIEETVLRQRAQSGDMAISSDRIDRAIIETPQFQIGGRFDSDLALRTMATQGFTAGLYRESLSQQMLLGQLANAFSSSNFVTDSELERVAELTRQTRDFRYLSIPMGTRTLDTQITDAQISEYYEANQEDFREDASIVARYVVLDQAEIAEEIEVPEEELRAQYEAEQEAFEGASEKRASHILFEVGAKLREDEAPAQANQAKARLDAGEDFGDLAQELSSDTISARDGGDIGYTDGTAFPAAVEEALASLSLDEVSDPAVSEFGVHLVKLTEDNESTFQPYEEVVDRIERELKSAEVELLYAERLESLSNLAFETGELQTISEQLGLEVQTSAAFTRNGGGGLFSNQQLVTAAFSDSVLIDGNNSDPIELADGTRAVVLRVEEYNESAIPPLEEVEPQIAVLLRAEMEREAVQELGGRVLQAVQSGNGLDEILTENNLDWVALDNVNRNATTANRQVVAEAFSLPAPEGGESEMTTLTLANGTYILIELTEVTPGSLATLSAEEALDLTTQMASDHGSNDFQAYLNTLRANADIQSRTVAPVDEF